MFSNSTKYAIRAIDHLLRIDNNKKVSVTHLAKALDIPQPFLSKILQQLSKANLISSTKGRSGGFYLTNTNLEHPLIDIVVCIEGYDVFEKCILGLKECSDKKPCLLHKYYKVFKQSLRKEMHEESIKELFSLPEIGAS